MMIVSRIAGIFGIIVALLGVMEKLHIVGNIRILGRHEPVTYLIIGILFVVVGIWLAVMDLQAKK